MSLFDRVTAMLALEPWNHPPLQTRAETEPGSLLDLATRLQGLRTRPWRIATVDTAMSVPSIFRAVTMISNIVGSLSLRAYRAGAEMAQDDRPRLVIRPNPFTVPREFFRETAWSMAAYGEAWWWIAIRDGDDQPMSLMPIHPREIVVDHNPDDLRYPIITWRGQRKPNRDMIQIKMTGEPGALRGKGPLQMCGAAVSVAVEAQEWAANFFADGGIPSLWIKAAGILDENEAAALLAQFKEGDHNTPRVTDSGIEDIKEFGVNQQGAQMFTARDVQNGEAARMFGIPGGLLEYAIAGAAITYQNVSQEFAKFVRVCLLPDYLEPMEQAISDLLPRATVARFNTEALERADIKTLYEVAGIGMDKGIFNGNDEARQIVGLSPSIETAPTPFAPPQAFPSPSQIVPRSQPEQREVRCPKCHKLILRAATPPWSGECPRPDCKAAFEVAA